MEQLNKRINRKQKQEFPLKEGKRQRETDKTEDEIQKEYELMVKKAKIQREIRREITNLTEHYGKGLCKRSIEGRRREITRRKEMKRGKEDEKEEESEKEKGKLRKSAK